MLVLELREAKSRVPKCERLGYLYDIMKYNGPQGVGIEVYSVYT